MKGHHSIKKKDRARGIEAVKAYLKGKRKDIPLVEEAFPEGLEFESLEQEVKEIPESATEGTRTEDQFKMALYRSLCLAFQGSPACLRTGLDNEERQLYEGIRLGLKMKALQ